ncbi:MAG: hypothetical protein AMXMBFR34_45090 [Myxococcaceae bacterium]
MIDFSGKVRALDVRVADGPGGELRRRSQYEFDYAPGARRPRRGTGLRKAWGVMGVSLFIACGSAGSVDAGHTLSDTALVGLTACSPENACDAGICTVIAVADGDYRLCVPSELDLCAAMRCPPDLPDCKIQTSFPAQWSCARKRP